MIMIAGIVGILSAFLSTYVIPGLQPGLQISCKHPVQPAQVDINASSDANWGSTRAA